MAHRGAVDLAGDVGDQAAKARVVTLPEDRKYFFPQSDDPEAVPFLAAVPFLHGLPFVLMLMAFAMTSASVMQMNTGVVLAGKPSMGSWVTYGLGSENRNLPGFVVMAAADEAELRHMVRTAAVYDDGPIAFRYPRGEGVGVEGERGMTFLGMLALHDPPRADAAEAVAGLRALGVTVKMVTGDNRHVAAAVAERVGVGARVLAAAQRIPRRVGGDRQQPGSEARARLVPAPRADDGQEGRLQEILRERPNPHHPRQETLHASGMAGEERLEAIALVSCNEGRRSLDGVTWPEGQLLPSFNADPSSGGCGHNGQRHQLRDGLDMANREPAVPAVLGYNLLVRRNKLITEKLRGFAGELVGEAEAVGEVAGLVGLHAEGGV